VHPDKLSRLQERLVNPVQSGGPCPLPSFQGHQEFYHDFILHSSHPAFLQHLADSLASEILALNETSFVASDLEDKGMVILNMKYGSANRICMYKNFHLTGIKLIEMSTGSG
jgi:hypothetical protein